MASQNHETGRWEEGEREGREDLITSAVCSEKVVIGTLESMSHRIQVVSPELVRI